MRSVALRRRCEGLASIAGRSSPKRERFLRDAAGPRVLSVLHVPNVPNVPHAPHVLRVPCSPDPVTIGVAGLRREELNRERVSSLSVLSNMAAVSPVSPMASLAQSRTAQARQWSRVGHRGHEDMAPSIALEALS